MLRLFYYLLFLTGFFILLEIAFAIQASELYLNDFIFVSKRLQLPASLLPDILFYCSAQLTIHLLYCIFITLCTISITKLLQLQKIQLNMGIALWILGIFVILALNQYYFPNSKFAMLSSAFFPFSIIGFIAYTLMFVWFCILLLAMVEPILLVYSDRSFIYAASIAAVLITSILSYPTQQKIVVTQKMPNIIIVGIDSLRPDFLSYFGGVKTPHIDSLLKQSVVFSDAVTPLARTFPAWMSILTGQYPKETGARYDLTPFQHLKLSNSLTFILHKAGYHTIYATDEVRFSNIDQAYGFEQVISPPMNVNDFLLGSINDFPISNLLINSRIGAVLFPYSYGNRPAYVTYDPAVFIQKINSELSQAYSQPIFLAVHFCLPHQPYMWASMNGQDIDPRERYMNSIEQADQQIGDFFAMLQQHHLLDQAIVVLLSDHGEALELSGDRVTEQDSYTQQGNPPIFYPTDEQEIAINKTVGHGTDVLGLPQYHSLLAFKVYGDAQILPHAVPGVVTLMDIKPTILELIGLPDESSSGISLRRAIIGESQPDNWHDHIFLESDFSPEAIRTVYPDLRKVILEGVDLFSINAKTARLEINGHMGKMIIESKQYADIHHDWMLAIYPQPDHKHRLVLINLKTGLWTDDITSDFAQHSPAKQMLAALENFFSIKTTLVSNKHAQA